MRRLRPARLFALLSLLLVPLAHPRADPPVPGELYPGPAVEWVELSPGGDLVLAFFTEYGTTTIRLLEREGERSADVHHFVSGSPAEVQLVTWVGRRTFVIASADGSRRDVVRVDPSGDEIRLESVKIEWPGVLVHRLPDREDEVLWSPLADRGSVYRVSWSALTSPADGDSPFVRKRRVARMGRPVTGWLFDLSGAPRLAFMEAAGGGFEFWVPEDGDGDDWNRLVYEPRAEDDWIFPVGYAPDGRLMVASRYDTGRIALYTYDPDHPGPPTPVLGHPSRDLTGLFLNTQGGPVVAAYRYEKGRPRLAFLREDEQRAWQAVEDLFPGSSALPMQRSLDGRIWALWVGSASDPGRFVVSDGGQILMELGLVQPRVRLSDLGPVETISVDVPDVGTIEAYLTLPPSGEPRPPVVIYPHGGPVGVTDVALFNPGIQYLASRGFAVLQVNYRGSGGLGREFEQAGWREWGRGIEDDIDAVFDRLVAEGLVDHYRVCIMGESYGGYSAVMSVIRHPKRFRCAISTMGVSDIGLIFSSTDSAETAEGREAWQRMLGNPDFDYEEMKRYSPVYRVPEIETPLLLIHGDADRRVDVEHTLRLAAMLELYGKPHRVVIQKGLGHSFGSDRWQRQYYEMVADFLYYYLE